MNSGNRQIVKPVTIDGVTFVEGEEDELEKLLAPLVMCDLMIDGFIEGDWESMVPDKE